MGTASAGALCFLNTNVLRSHVLVTLPLCVLMRGWQHCSALEFPFHPQPCCQPAARYICYLFGEVHLLLIMEFRCCPPLERKADFNLQSGNQILKPNVFFFYRRDKYLSLHVLGEPACKIRARGEARGRDLYVNKQRGRSLNLYVNNEDGRLAHSASQSTVSTGRQRLMCGSWDTKGKDTSHQPPRRSG